jgi:drug/metabolite transporter (DMT)-like permease
MNPVRADENSTRGIGYRGASVETLPKKGLFYLALLSFLWGSAWPFVKIAVSEIGPWRFRTLCVGSSAIFLLAFAKGSGKKLLFPKNELVPLLVVSLLNITGWNMLSAYGVSYMHAGRAVIIGFTMPVWASILGVLILGERLDLRRFVGLVFGMSGLGILLAADIKALGSAPMGPVLMLGSAVCWGAGTVLVKYFRWTAPTIVLAAWQFVLGSIPIVIGGLAVETVSGFHGLSLKGALAAAYVSMLCMPVGWWAWFKVVTLLPAGVAALGTIAVPLIGVFSSWLVLEEPIGFREVAALVLVVASLTTGWVRTRRRA